MRRKEKIFIVGPCSAESEEQVLEAAASIRAVQAAIDSESTSDSWVVFRAGIWKPRTSPDTFQGAGEPALRWMQRASKQTGLPTATEVATPEHVARALESGITCLWIGARTSANPIAVQAIADAIVTKTMTMTQTMTKTQTIVMVKNPVNEDIDLWIGDVERLEKTGVRVMAIHRGCGHRPCWKMAFEFRRRRPDIPLLLDPSHLSGDANKVAELCQIARTLDFDGLMIEVHPHPEQALSDARQQITPEALRAIMEDTTPASDTLPLLELRKEIDEVDDALWTLIARRMEVSRRIGDYKRERGMAVIQPQRYEQILQERIARAQEQGISEQAIRQIMEAIHTESVRVQL